MIFDIHSLRSVREPAWACRLSGSFSVTSSRKRRRGTRIWTPARCEERLILSESSSLRSRATLRTLLRLLRYPPALSKTRLSVDEHKRTQSAQKVGGLIPLTSTTHS